MTLGGTSKLPAARNGKKVEERAWKTSSAEEHADELNNGMKEIDHLIKTARESFNPKVPALQTAVSKMKKSASTESDLGTGSSKKTRRRYPPKKQASQAAAGKRVTLLPSNPLAMIAQLARAAQAAEEEKATQKANGVTETGGSGEGMDDDDADDDADDTRIVPGKKPLKLPIIHSPKQLAQKRRMRQYEWKSRHDRALATKKQIDENHEQTALRDSNRWELRREAEEAEKKRQVAETIASTWISLIVIAARLRGAAATMQEQREKRDLYRRRDRAALYIQCSYRWWHKHRRIKRERRAVHIIVKAIRHYTITRDMVRQKEAADMLRNFLGDTMRLPVLLHHLFALRFRVIILQRWWRKMLVVLRCKEKTLLTYMNSVEKQMRNGILCAATMDLPELAQDTLRQYQHQPYPAMGLEPTDHHTPNAEEPEPQVEVAILAAQTESEAPPAANLSQQQRKLLVIRADFAARRLLWIHKCRELQQSYHRGALSAEDVQDYLLKRENVVDYAIGAGTFAYHMQLLPPAEYVVALIMHSRQL